jgi:hypothetical protein
MLKKLGAAFAKRMKADSLSRYARWFGIAKKIDSTRNLKFETKKV